MYFPLWFFFSRFVYPQQNSNKIPVPGITFDICNVTTIIPSPQVTTQHPFPIIRVKIPPKNLVASPPHLPETPIRFVSAPRRAKLVQK